MVNGARLPVALCAIYAGELYSELEMLKGLVATLLIPACAAALLWSFFSLRAEFVLSSVLNNSQIEGLAGLGKIERERELQEAKRAAALIGAPAAAYLHLSSVARELGFTERDPTRRMELFCQGLESAGRALQFEPFNSRFLINWANLRQLLAQADCGLALTQGDFKAALSAARKADPTNPELMYAAALINSWSGESGEVKSLLRDVLTYKTRFDPVEERFIASQFKSEGDLLDVVPARFPQAAYWTDWVLKNAPAQYPNLAAGFSSLQLRALEASRAELDSGAVDYEIHRDRLLSLLPNASDSQVRALLDGELALMMERDGQPRLGEYLRQRSALSSLEILRSSLDSDTRPLKGNLAHWGGQQAVYLDNFYQSVGFYLPAGQTLKLIELVSDKPGLRVSVKTLSILVSQNNLDWQQLVAGAEPVAYQLAGRTLIALRPAEGAFKYWKIHFDSPERGKTFGGSLNSLVKVYGLTSRNAR